MILGLLVLRITGLLLFLIGLLIITGGFVITVGFVFGSTRGLLLLRIIEFCIGDAVFGNSVRLSDVLTFESINNLDLFVLLLKEYTPEYIRCLEPLLLYI